MTSSPIGSLISTAIEIVNAIVTTTKNSIEIEKCDAEQEVDRESDME